MQLLYNIHSTGHINLNSHDSIATVTEQLSLIYYISNSCYAIMRICPVNISVTVAMLSCELRLICPVLWPVGKF